MGAALLGCLALLLKDRLLTVAFSDWMEFFVGVMIMGIGVSGLLSARKFEAELRRSEKRQHYHLDLDDDLDRDPSGEARQDCASSEGGTLSTSTALSMSKTGGGSLNSSTAMGGQRERTGIQQQLSPRLSQASIAPPPSRPLLKAATAGGTWGEAHTDIERQAHVPREPGEAGERSNGSAVDGEGLIRGDNNMIPPPPPPAADFSKLSLATVLTGVVHGVSGSGHLLGVLPALTLRYWWASAAYLAAFTIGCCVWMSLFTLAIGEGTVRLRQHFRRPDLPAKIAMGTSCVAIFVGFLWMVFWFLKTPESAAGAVEGHHTAQVHQGVR